MKKDLTYMTISTSRNIIHWILDITRATATGKKCFNKNSLYRGSFPYILLFQEYRSFSRVLRYLEVRYMEVPLYINEITVLCFSNTIKSNVDSNLFYLAVFFSKYILEPCISKGWSLPLRARLYRERVRLELLHIFLLSLDEFICKICQK